MKHPLKPTLFAVCAILALLLAACGLSPEEVEATGTQIAADIYASQTAQAPTATNTPLPTHTFTPEPTATPTPLPTDTTVPTPTEGPCGNVDLNGRYVDYRTFRGAMYGWVMDVEQTGCEIKATEYFFLKAQGPGSMGYPTELTGTIEDHKVRVCYTVSGYCLNLVIYGGGDKLVNGVESWQYEKSGEVPQQGEG